MRRALILAALTALPIPAAAQSQRERLRPTDIRRRFGLRAEGFVAPAWLYSPAAAQAVRSAGFRYLTTHLRLRDLTVGRDVWSFGVSNRPGSLDWDMVGRGVNTLFVALHSPAPLVRIAIHPADVDFHRPFLHTLWLLRGLLAAGRQPATYAQICDLIESGEL